MKKAFILLSLLFCYLVPLKAQNFQYIALQKNAHPAVKSAAKIMARKLNIPENHIIEKRSISIPPKGTIVLDYGKPSRKQLRYIGQDPRKVEYDGYLIKFNGNRALIFGKRPRSLLYAAGDVHWWKNRTSGIYVRQPEFKTRDISLGGGHSQSVADQVAELGANAFFVRFSANFISLKKEFPQVYKNIPESARKKMEQNRQVDEIGTQVCQDPAEMILSIVTQINF